MSTRDGAVTGLDPISVDLTAADDPRGPEPDGGSAGAYLDSPAAVTAADGPDGSDLALANPEILSSATDPRTVTSAAGALLAAAAPAPARTWTVSDVAEPPALPDSVVDGTRGSRLAVVATAFVVTGVLAGLGWLVYSAWTYITTTPDAAQQAHWEQLRGLIDLVVAIVLLVVGTVLGASLQARWTSSARVQAREQARAAAEQNAAARSNADAARRNAAAAVTAASDLARALELLEQARPLLSELQDIVAGRDRTQTQFLTARSVTSAIRETHVSGFRVDRTGDVRLAEVADEGVDRLLTTLSVRAGVVASHIGEWLVRRR